MNDDGIGRILVASLHQSIGEALPMRLEYYEHWLSPMGLKDGRAGRAPLGAVLSFLRQEGQDAYDQVMTGAGRHSAQWHHQQHARSVALLRRLPHRVRTRLALGQCRRLLRAAFAPAVVTVSMHGGVGIVAVTGAVFCALRETWPWPTCRYFVAAIEQHLALQGLGAEVRITGCQGAGDAACTLQVTFGSPGEDSSPAVSATQEAA